MGNVGKATPDVPNQGWGLYIVSVVMVIISGLFVMARIAVRLSRNMMGWDDYMIILALLSLIFLAMTECSAVVEGYGKHMKDLSHDQAIKAFRWFYGAQIIYKIAVCFYKLSMLFLYLRLFTGRSFRIMTFILIGITTGMITAFTFGTIFQCHPISAFWDKSLLKQPGTKCLTPQAFWMSFSLINITIDFLVLLLPIREVVKLQLPWKEKLALCGLFSLGIFVCATTVIRTTTLKASAKSNDPSWGIIPATIWSVVEANTGTICACLPIFKRPLVDILPRLRHTASSARLYHRGYPKQKSNPSHASKAESKVSLRAMLTKKSSMTLGKATPLKELDANVWNVESPTSNKTTASPLHADDHPQPPPNRASAFEPAPEFPMSGAPGILKTTDVDIRYGRDSGSTNGSTNATGTGGIRGNDVGGWVETVNAWEKAGKRLSRVQIFHEARGSEEDILPK